VAACHLVFMVGYAGQLLLSGHWVMAPGMLILAVATSFAMRRMQPRDAGAARRLLLAGDGRMHVATVGGAVRPLALGGESLWLGSSVLLVLRAAGRTHRLLLGPGNLDPARLATLRRRLRGAGTAAGDPAVDSRTLSGQGVSVVQLSICANKVRS
jgi:hypothetical protein